MLGTRVGVPLGASTGRVSTPQEQRLPLRVEPQKLGAFSDYDKDIPYRFLRLRC